MGVPVMVTPAARMQGFRGGGGVHPGGQPQQHPGGEAFLRCRQSGGSHAVVGGDAGDLHLGDAAGTQPVGQ